MITALMFTTSCLQISQPKLVLILNHSPCYIQSSTANQNKPQLAFLTNQGQTRYFLVHNPLKAGVAVYTKAPFLVKGEFSEIKHFLDISTRKWTKLAELVLSNELQIHDSIVIFRFPVLFIGFQARYLTSWIKRIDQILSALFQNGFKSEKWLCIFTSRDSRRRARNKATPNSTMLTGYVRSFRIFPVLEILSAKIYGFSISDEIEFNQGPECSPHQIASHDKANSQ